MIAALWFTGQSLMAETIRIGSANNTNCVPFGCANDITEYQQVYSSSSFISAGLVPFDIAAISFFRELSPVPDAVTPANYVISLSTTSAAVGGLSPLLDNIGFDNQVFYSGVLGGIIGTELTVAGNGATPVFTYNPLQGNLLLDITISGVSGLDTGIMFDAENNSDPATRVMSRAFNSLAEDVGLVTEFSTTVPSPISEVPEPSTLLLMGSGLILLGQKLRRRKLNS